VPAQYENISLLRAVQHRANGSEGSRRPLPGELRPEIVSRRALPRFSVSPWGLG